MPIKAEQHAVSLLRADGEGSGEGTSEQIYFVGRAHTSLQEMLKMADQKATGFIAVFAIIGALVGSSWLSTIWSTYRALSGEQAVAMGALGLVTLGASLASLFCSALVLKPRFPKSGDVKAPSEAPLLMWADDLARYERDPEGYLQALKALPATGILADLAYDNLKISWILRQKYRWLNPGLYCLFAGLVGWAIVICAVILKNN
jgi:Family of unknown function (DUF5706)